MKRVALLLGICIVILLVTISFEKTAPQVSVPEPNNFVCNSPYIQVGTECCLDVSENGICDHIENAGKIIIPKTQVQESRKTTESTKYNPPIKTEVIRSETPNTGEGKVLMPTNPIHIEEAICGDGVCEKAIDKSVVTCNGFECEMQGKTVETAISCPKDCGTKCDESVNLKIISCDVLNSDSVELVIENAGTRAITGVSMLLEAKAEPINFKKALKSTGQVSNIKSTTTQFFIDTLSQNIKSGEQGRFALPIRSVEESLNDKINKLHIVPNAALGSTNVQCSNQRLVYTLDKCTGITIAKG